MLDRPKSVPMGVGRPQVYRAISEGVINLADCFFDMEYLDASKGLEIYRQSIADNERLSNFYAQAEQIEELKRSTQFPKLTPTSPEFLTLMEEYVREVRTLIRMSTL